MVARFLIPEENWLASMVYLHEVPQAVSSANSVEEETEQSMVMILLCRIRTMSSQQSPVAQIKHLHIEIKKAYESRSSPIRTSIFLIPFLANASSGKAAYLGENSRLVMWPSGSTANKHTTVEK